MTTKHAAKHKVETFTVAELLAAGKKGAVEDAIAAYLDAQHAAGFKLVSFSHSSGNWAFVFVGE